MDLRDACLFAEFSHNCARISNNLAQKVYLIKDVINISRVSVEMPLKHVTWGRWKLASLWLANKASCVNYVRSPFQTAKVIANTHSTDQLRIRMMVSSVMGKISVPQIWDYNLVSIDHLVLIARWSSWVHSLDCLFVIYKLSKLIFRFLKTSSRNEVINKVVLLNWMNARYIQHSFGKRKFSLGLDCCIIGGKKTLSKFPIKIYYF